MVCAQNGGLGLELLLLLLNAIEQGPEAGLLAECEALPLLCLRDDTFVQEMINALIDLELNLGGQVKLQESSRVRECMFYVCELSELLPEQLIHLPNPSLEVLNYESPVEFAIEFLIHELDALLQQSEVVLQLVDAVFEGEN